MNLTKFFYVERKAKRLRNNILPTEDETHHNTSVYTYLHKYILRLCQQIYDSFLIKAMNRFQCNRRIMQIRGLETYPEKATASIYETCVTAK